MLYLLFLAGIAGLVVIYMARPRFPGVRISAARFFVDDPAVSRGAIEFGRPRPNRSFYLQLAVLLALLGALIVLNLGPARERLPRVGVWFIVDDSASMSTEQDGATRMDAARSAIANLAARAREASARGEACFDLSTFDLAFHDVRRDLGESALSRAAAELKPKPLGTDLGLVRQAAARAAGQQAGCPMTHLAVITDMPAPAWVAALPPGALWLDISKPVGNVGVTGIAAVRDAFGGGVEKARFEVQAFGPISGTVRARISGPDGTARVERELNASVERQWAIEFPVDRPGPFRLTLSPGGAYSYDDNAEIDVPAAEPLRVDWRAGRRDLLKQLGWQEDAVHPDLRVAPLRDDNGGAPSVLVGEGYRPRPGATQPLWGFSSASRLVNSLNFDVAERAGIIPAAALGAAFAPVLAGPDGAVWAAERERPRAAYIPGLPIEGDDSLARFSATIFFNAVRWSLDQNAAPALFTLTSPDEERPEGNRLALHPGEGNTERVPASYGAPDFRAVDSAREDRRKSRLWPLLVLFALGVFLVERRQSIFGGPRWT